MPGLGAILEAMGDDGTTDGPFKLLLPSELSVEDRSAWCLPHIPPLEFRFRYAQADDNLAELRRLLRLFQNLRIQNSKHLNLAQRALTRTKGLFNSLRARIDRSTDRYSHARKAMLGLDPDQRLGPGWMKRFQELNQGDVRGPGREFEDTSEGRFTPSWIWLVPRLSQPFPPTRTARSGDHVATVSSANDSGTAEDLEANESMRSHWAKCQARAERYEEEVKLTVEEMGRTLRYFEWKRVQWLSLQSQREASEFPPPASVQRGLRAYAHRQANNYDTLALSFVSRWRKTLNSHNLHPTWLSDYPATSDHSKPETNSKSSRLEGVPPPSPSPPFPSPPSQDGNPSTPTTSDIDIDDGDDNDGDDGDDNDSDDGDNGDNNNDNDGSDDDECVGEAAVYSFDLEDEWMV